MVSVANTFCARTVSVNGRVTIPWLTTYPDNSLEVGVGSNSESVTLVFFGLGTQSTASQIESTLEIDAIDI